MKNFKHLMTICAFVGLFGASADVKAMTDLAKPEVSQEGRILVNKILEHANSLKAEDAKALLLESFEKSLECLKSAVSNFDYTGMVTIIKNEAGCELETITKKCTPKLITHLFTNYKHFFTDINHISLYSICLTNLITQCPDIKEYLKTLQSFYEDTDVQIHFKHVEEEIKSELGLIKKEQSDAEIAEALKNAFNKICNKIANYSIGIMKAMLYPEAIINQLARQNFLNILSLNARMCNCSSSSRSNPTQPTEPTPATSTEVVTQ
ncbi:MAG: hypothetical protein US49_C0001G0028 [candidate division TM6 bacterium GW2011_GWF2_37_49]|nr:MAG: hypothetical protein US49_C0001G0028 [candidate division TM6 bacterium GW2011_GWF2_37_49]